MYPVVGLGPEDNVPSGDYDAAEMNRLRGVAIVQAAETEAVLAEILRLLDSSASRKGPAGNLMKAVRKRLDAHTLGRWSWALDTIDEAIKRRNKIVHYTVQIGYSWREYATGGGGEHVPVISYLSNEDRDECDERELEGVLELQRRATESAIEVLHFLKHREGDSEEARYCGTCRENKEEDQQTDDG
jgi:hypothetical protein